MWKKSFSDLSLIRGSHIADDAIMNYDSSGDVLRAQVTGTKLYSVTIDLNEAIALAQCTCPYYESGNLCKHIVAVRLKYASEQNEQKVETITEYVERLTYSDMKSLLIDLLSKSREAQMIIDATPEFRQQYVTLETLKNTIDYIIQECRESQDEDGWEDYYSYREDDYEIPTHLVSLHQFTLDIAMLVDETQYEDACEGAIYYFRAISELLGEDYIEDSSSLISCAVNLLEVIYHILNPQQHRTCFELIFQLLIIDHIFYEADNLLEMWEEKFATPEILADRIIYAKEQLQQLSENGDSHQIATWVLIILKSYTKMGIINGKRLVYINRYIKLEEVATYYIKELFTEHDYREVINRSEVFLKDKEPYSYKELYSILKDSYQKVGEIGHHQRVLSYMLTNRIFNLELYYEYKESFDRVEWELIHSEFIKSIPQDDYRAEIYKAEAMYPQLMYCVDQSNDLDLLIYYQDDLKMDFLNEIIKKYKKELRRKAEFTGGRKYYREIVAILRSMLSLGNTEEAVKDLIQEFDATYRNRPAMREELSKISF